MKTKNKIAAIAIPVVAGLSIVATMSTRNPDFTIPEIALYGTQQQESGGTISVSSIPATEAAPDLMRFVRWTDSNEVGADVCAAVDLACDEWRENHDEDALPIYRKMDLFP